MRSSVAHRSRPRHLWCDGCLARPRPRSDSTRPLSGWRPPERESRRHRRLSPSEELSQVSCGRDRTLERNGPPVEPVLPASQGSGELLAAAPCRLPVALASRRRLGAVPGRGLAGRTPAEPTSAVGHRFRVEGGLDRRRQRRRGVGWKQPIWGLADERMTPNLPCQGP